jgi:hypothetical protein
MTLMYTNHLEDEQLILHYYGEAEAGENVDAHLTHCDHCREQYQNLLRVLNSVDSAPVPARGPEYGAQVWQKVAPRIRQSKWPLSVFIHVHSWQKWVAAATMAVLLIGAFLAGRHSSPSKQPISIAGTGQVRDRILMVAVGDHLERSQMVLVEIANSTGAANIAPERAMAENLVEANRIYRQTAAATGEPAVAGFLDDLERVLLDIAHSPDEVSGQQLEALRHSIEAQGLLFKVRVVGTQLRERSEQPPAAGKTRKL